MIFAWRYGVRGRVAPGSVVRVFHPQAGPQGEEISTDPGTGIYSAYWSVSGGFGSGVTRVELLVRGTLEGEGTGGTDAVADQRVWAVLPASAESYEYDGAGRTVEDSLWHYDWNGMGRLVGMQRKAGTSVEPELTSELMAFVYDAEGRRTQKTRTRTYTNAPTKVESSKVFWTDWLPVYEELSVNGGTPSRRWFIWGQDVSGSWDGAGGIGGLLAIREEGGRTLLPVHDGLGNITAVIHAGTGDTVARYDYAPFGELVAESGDVNACPFRYQSKYYDAETGLSYFGYRYYSAKLGRWISRDPLGEGGGFNLYGYCGNDPVNKWDYLGLDAASEMRASFLLPDGSPFAAKLLNLSSKQLRDKIVSAYVLEAFRQGGSYVAAENAAMEALVNVYQPAWEASQLASRRATEDYNRALDEFQRPGGSFVAGIPNQLKDEGSTMLAFVGSEVLLTQPMGFQYVAGARYDSKTNSFRVKWGSEDVSTGEQLLAAGFMFVGGFGDDLVKGANYLRKTQRTADIFYVLNKTHARSLPIPKGTGPMGGRLQSHHALQQQWALENLTRHGYNPKLAPSITLETGAGFPHSVISQLQNARRDARLAQGSGKWGSSLQEELGYIVSDFRSAGFADDVIAEVLEQQYKMLDKLKIGYKRVEF